MSGVTRLKILTPEGIPLTDSLDFISLEYAKSVNAVGSMTVNMAGGTVSEDWLQEDFRLQSWRSGDGHSEYLDMDQTWFITRVIHTIGTDQKHTIQVTAESALGLAARRQVLYANGTTEATIADQADDAMKEIVRYNLMLAASQPLVRFMTVDANVGQGYFVNKQVAWRGVLQVLQELARDSEFNGIPVFFDIVTDTSKVTDMLIFRTWTGQPGNDRSVGDYEILSLDNRRLRTSQWGFDRSSTVNVLYALGEEKFGVRAVQSATDDTALITPFSRRESTMDARAATLSSELLAEARAELNRKKPKVAVMAEIADVDDFRYGLHWRYGDRLVVKAGNKTYACLIEGVSVSVSGQREQVRAVLRF